MRIISILWFAFLVGSVSSVLFAYPSSERRPSTQSQPPLDLGLQTATGYVLSDDDSTLYVTYGETFKAVDLGTFAIEASQPYAISSDTNYSGAIKGIAYIPASNKMFATQDGGNLLTYDLAKITETPTKIAVASGKAITNVAADPDNSVLYIYNSTDGQIIKYPINSGDSSQIDVKTALGGSFIVNDMVFVRNVSGSVGTLYISTNTGRLGAIPANAAAVTTITLDSGGTHDLKGIAALPTSGAIYVVDATDKTVRAISTSTNAQTASIDVSANSDVNQIAVHDVTNPTATYGFVMGSKGVSIFNTADNDVFDLGSTTTDDEPLSVSGTGPVLAGDDGYLFLSFGKISVLSDNPWVTIGNVAYSSGSSLGIGGSVVLTFEADETGTYAVRAGGTTAATGTVLTDGAGATSGTVAAADTAQTVTLSYSANSSAFSEGANTVYIFVTDGAGNVGRRATTVTVDTPPPPVTIQSTSFGTEKIYVNLKRLDVADISMYRVYADPDAAAVMTKTSVSGSTAQTSSGTEPTVVVTGLSNRTLYYVAVEAVDANGNVSTSRTNTFAGGGVATGQPEATYGPAGRAGERGCSLVIE